MKFTWVIMNGAVTAVSQTITRIAVIAMSDEEIVITMLGIGVFFSVIIAEIAKWIIINL